jgi:hypothetical protein
MNKENIQKVIDAIEAEAVGGRRVGFNMSGYICVPNRVDTPKNYKGDVCGTAACIAGYAYLALSLEEGRDFEDVLLRGARSGMYVAETAQDWLGLTDRQSDELFAPFHYSGAIPPSAGVQVLKHLLETGEVDWEVVDGYDADRHAWPWWGSEDDY